MKKSYHSTVLPMQDAIATFRSMAGDGVSWAAPATGPALAVGCIRFPPRFVFVGQRPLSVREVEMHLDGARRVAIDQIEGTLLFAPPHAAYIKDRGDRFELDWDYDNKRGR